MKRSVDVLVLLGTGLAERDVVARLCELGHRACATLRSLTEVIQAVEVRSLAHLRPDVILADAEHTRHPGGVGAIERLAHLLEIRVVYVASTAANLARPWPGGAGRSDQDPITCTLDAQSLSLAISLSLSRRELERLRAQHSGVVTAELAGSGSSVHLDREAHLLQRRWHYLLSSTPMVIYSSQPWGSFSITSISDNITALLGHEARAFLDNPRFWLDCIHPADAPRVLAALAGILDHERYVDEYRLQHRDGTYRWIHDTRRLARDDDGSVLEIVGSWLDITERRHAEDALKTSEGMLKAIIEDQTELICRFLPDGTLTFVNDAYCRYFDKRAEELVGHTFMPLIPEEDWATIQHMIPSLSPTNPMVTTEHRVIMPSGDIRWQNWTNRAILNSVGEIAAYQAVGRDVTERKLAEEALRQSEARYSSIFHSAAVPIWEEDISALERALADLGSQGIRDLRTHLVEHPDQILALWNQSQLLDINDEGLKLFGARSRDELARVRGQLMVPESLPGLREGLVAIAEGKHRFEHEIAFQTLAQERVILLLRMSIPLPGSRFQSMLMSCIDITERTRAEEKIKQLNADLSQRAAALQVANTELESFSYSVSHDLRAPLRAINGFSKALLDDYASVLDERGCGYLRRVGQASQRMAELIDDLLDLSRMSRSTMHIVPCDLSELALGIVRELRRTQPEREVDVIIEPGLLVHADASLLHTALENLLGNAWKFTSKQPHARIELGTTRHDGQTAYFVRDNGAGFDMTYVHKLFNPFQRLHTVHEFEGTGIGLATVKRIVQRHGGDIWVEARINEGATFTFTLPTLPMAQSAE